MPLRPVAVYGCEVPPGDQIVPALPDLGPYVAFPGFRITMAAINPNEEADPEELKNFPRPRATLTIIRMNADDESDDEEDLEFRKAMADLGSDSDSDSTSGSDSDEETNGGPSDPTKSKKARKEAAVKELIASLKGEDSDEEMEEANGTNGVVASKKKGKAKATEEDEEDSTSEDSDSDDEEDVQEYVVCTLDPENHCQQTLDISVGTDEIVYFRVTGTHTVYITGNYQVTDEFADEQDRRKELLEDYPSEDDSEDSELDLSPDEDELTLGMDDESDELDDLEDPRITEVDSDEEEAPKLIKASAEKEKKGKNKRTADELDEGTSLDDIMAKSLKTDAAEEPKLSKKQLKKLKKNNGEAAAVKPEEQKNGVAKDVTPAKSDKSDKKVQFAKNLEQGPTGSAEKPKSAEKEKTKLGPKKVNGVTIDDKKLGSGPAAKKGDRVGMRYIGKLQDGKVFDSNKSGKPFSFKLGAGEVIKGWDVGVPGMSIGGERRLTIPANLAYGSKAQPGIPANSTLVFDIKMLEIK